MNIKTHTFRGTKYAIDWDEHSGSCESPRASKKKLPQVIINAEPYTSWKLEVAIEF